MQLSTASRKKANIRMAIQGPSGAGKTYSSLLIAYGLCKDWSKIAVVDTEQGSSHLYSSLGSFKVLTLSAPHTPERYIEAITTCEASGMEVIIIDSTTHEWEYLLDYHSSLPGNSFTNWNKVTPRHNQFIQKLLLSRAHIIATIRTKQDYVLSDKNGTLSPEKVGLKSVQRDGLEYEFTLVFDVDIRNNARASKDRTGLFFGKPQAKLTVQTGEQIASWCESGKEMSPEELMVRISSCTAVEELFQLYYQYPQFQGAFKTEYETQKRKILIQQQTQSVILPIPSNNGTTH